MTNQFWQKEFPGAITVSDLDGIILDMNDRAAADYADRGGRALIGTNMLDCHPEPARTRVAQLLEARQRNVYTIEKNGRQEADLSVTLVRIRSVPWIC